MMSSKQGTTAIGVIGVGLMGGHHVGNLALQVHNAQLLALADADEIRLHEAADKYEVSYRFSNPQDLIDHPQIDAVLIAAPDRWHATLAESCILAGKPVLVEKPLATDSNAALAVVSMELARGKRLVQVGFMRQYDPAHITVKDRVGRGDLGRAMALRNLHASNTPGHTPRSVGEVMFNSLIHECHTARWMMGEEVTQVFAQALPWPAHPGSARFAAVQLCFQSGALGILAYNDSAEYGYQVEVEVTCETGIVASNSMAVPTVTHRGQERREVTEDWGSRFGAAYLAEVQAWTASVIQGIPTGPTAWDGYRALVIAEACAESAEKGLPISVAADEVPELYLQGTRKHK